MGGIKKTIGKGEENSYKGLAPQKIKYEGLWKHNTTTIMIIMHGRTRMTEVILPRYINVT